MTSYVYFGSASKTLITSK
uniref:Uncharacterized protein n=1 Tax=Rhizophora mucronata TaxID=61149 RepID=A0A2P2R3A7_RHIMU